jgi:DNA-binding transcriptional ArsR family regulator
MATGPAVTVDGDTVRLHGAGAIRAMAHPARLRVVDELYSDAATERTATELAALCGLTPSAMSYHLRALEKAGLVARAPARGDGRERPWRGRGRTISIENSDATADGGDVLAELAFERTRTMFGEWVAHRREHGADRPRISVLSNGQLWLTKTEAEALAAELEAAVQRRHDATGDHAARPDADRYAWSWALFPDVTGDGGERSSV